VGVYVDVRNLLAGLVAFVLAGCGSASGQAVASEPASPAREASPSSQPPASAGAWKLPVAFSTGSATAQGGFVSLLDGIFSSDPSANLTNSTVGSPPLKGTWPKTNVADYPSYDARLRRWVPVSPQQLTPDGTQYAYAEWVWPTGPVQGGPTPPSGIRIHVVDVAAATERVVYVTKSLLTVVAYEPEGIYVTNQCWEGCGNVGGLWLLDPSTGELKTILAGDTDHTEWDWIADGVAWGTGPFGAWSVIRLDLSTGAVEPWFTPTNSIGVVALDSRGFPIIETQNLNSNAVELWDGTSSSAGTRIFASPALVSFREATSGACGTWIGSTNGLYELASNDLLEMLQTVELPPDGLEVTGTCVAA
jgi:hypothetical protein